MRRLIDREKSQRDKGNWTASGGMYLVKYNHSMLQMKQRVMIKSPLTRMLKGPSNFK